ACPGADLDGADPEGAGSTRLEDAGPPRPEPPPSMTDTAPDLEPVATLGTSWRSRFPVAGRDGPAGRPSPGPDAPCRPAPGPAVPGGGVPPPAAEVRRRRRRTTAATAVSNRTAATASSTTVQGKPAALPVAVSPAAGGAGPGDPLATFCWATARFFAAR